MANEQREKDQHYRDFSNRKPYNNIPPAPGEVLVPVVVDEDMYITLTNTGLDKANMETWHFPKPVPVAFIAAEEAQFPQLMKWLYLQVNNYIASEDYRAQRVKKKLLERAHELALQNPRLYDHNWSTHLIMGEILQEEFFQCFYREEPYYAQIVELYVEGYRPQEIMEIMQMTTKVSNNYYRIRKAFRIARDLYDRYFR